MSESPSKWAALVAGLSFAGIGLFGLATSLPYYGDFAVRSRTEFRHNPGDPVYAVRFPGFDPGATALFCMVAFSLGVGIAASPFLGNTGRQNTCLLISTLWHALGIGTFACYLNLAPRPLQAWPFVWIGIFETLGLLPLALGLRRWFTKSRIEKGEGLFRSLESKKGS